MEIPNQVGNDNQGESSKNEQAHSYCRAAKSCACTLTSKGIKREITCELAFSAPDPAPTNLIQLSD